MNRLLALSRLRVVARAIVWASHDRAASSVSSYRNCLLMPTMTWRTRAAMTVARCQHPTIALQPTRWLPTCGGRRRMHATTTTTTSSATTPTASATASDTSNDEDDWPLEHLSRDDIYQHYMRKLEDNPDDALAACVAGIIELTRKKVATADSGAIPQAAADEADGGARAAVPLLTESLTQPDRSVPSVERVLQVDRDVALPQPNHQRHQRQQHQQASAAPWTDASDGRQRRKAFVRWVREEGRRLREMQGAAGETEAPTPAEHERLQRAYQLLLHSATLGFPLAAHFVRPPRDPALHTSRPDVGALTRHARLDISRSEAWAPKSTSHEASNGSNKRQLLAALSVRSSWRHSTCRVRASTETSPRASRSSCKRPRRTTTTMPCIAWVWKAARARDRISTGTIA